MKKFGRVLAALLLVVLAFTGCNNINSGKAGSDEAIVRFVINGIEARTVFPDVKATDLTDIKLTYKKTTEDTTSVKEWEKVSDIAAITLDTGTYDFTIEAKCKGFNYSGTANNFAVVVGENTVEIDLNFSSFAPEEMEGQGTIEHTYTFPSSEKIKVVKAGLYTYNTEDELEEAVAAEAVTVTDNADGTSTVSYIKTVDSAEYVLEYFFYADEEETLLMNTYSVTVYVLKDITSKKDELTENLCSVYTITYELNGGNWTEGYEAPVQFTSYSDELPEVQNIERAGYQFVKWTRTNSSDAEAITTVKGIASDLKVYAIWEANTDTPYTVKHWQQNIYDDEYTLVSTDTQTLTGTTATETAAQAKEYTGFEVLFFTQETIAGDGTSTVNIYYNRKVYYITFVLGSSTTTTVLDEYNRISGRYGAAVEIEAPVLAGSNFSGWINENNESEVLPETFTEDRTFIADFLSGTGAGFSLNVNGVQDIAVNAVFSVDAGTIVVTADEGYTDYKWTVNGIAQNSTAKEMNITLNGSENYDVKLTAKKNGIRYTNDIVIKLEDIFCSENAEVGDIVLENGKYVTSEGYSLVSSMFKPVGIVCHVNEDGTTGLMLGLTNSYATNTELKWVLSGTTGYNTNFTAIQGNETGGDMDGSDNWDEICAADPEGSANPAENYPVFNYALNYAQKANLTGTNYEDGWYVPTVYELYNYVYLNKTTLNSSLNKAGGTQLRGNFYWSSSQDYNGYYACVVNFYYGDVSGGLGYIGYVCCVRAF